MPQKPAPEMETRSPFAYLGCTGSAAVAIAVWSVLVLGGVWWTTR